MGRFGLSTKLLLTYVPLLPGAAFCLNVRNYTAFFTRESARIFTKRKPHFRLMVFSATPWISED